MTFSDIVGTKIISIYEQQIVGYVIDAIYNKKSQKITALVISDVNEETTKILKTKHVKSINSDFILIANISVLIFSESDENKCGNLINKQAIGVDGQSYGKVKNIEIGQNYIISKIVCEKDAFFVKDIYGENDVVFVKDKMKKRQPIFAPRTRIVKTKSAISQAVQIEPTTPTPLKVQPNGLLGKRLKRDLIVLGNRILARKNTAVTNELILSAKRLNVLPELELLSY